MRHVLLVLVFNATQVKELDAGCVLGQIALSHNSTSDSSSSSSSGGTNSNTGGSGYLFAGTADRSKPGTVRAYNFPLTGDFLEYPCMGAPVSRM
jgi:cilia- and flagella-associated protein 57